MQTMCVCVCACACIFLSIYLSIFIHIRRDRETERVKRLSEQVYGLDVAHLNTSDTTKRTPISFQSVQPPPGTRLPEQGRSTLGAVNYLAYANTQHNTLTHTHTTHIIYMIQNTHTNMLECSALYCMFTPIHDIIISKLVFRHGEGAKKKWREKQTMNFFLFYFCPP
jgi:hypothetical protein